MEDELLFKSAIWSGFAMAAFFFYWLSKKEVAPYGRHHDGASMASASPFMAILLPTRLAWFIMECPILLMIPPIFALGWYSSLPIPRVMASFFLAHYAHRTLIYPLRMRPSPNRHFPLHVLLSGVLFNVYNAYIQARSLSHYTSYPPDWLSSVPFVLGSAIFFTGMAINIWADSELMLLRKSDKNKDEASTAAKVYSIPRGGFFELVSCPNYFGELFEWLGWAIATWSWAGLVFFVLSVSNLAPRAVAHHRWYLKMFSDYPRSRKILVPFIF